MGSSNAEKAAREAYIAYHEGLSGFDAARAWDDMTSLADDWSQEAVDWEYAIKTALASRDAEVEVLREQLAAAEAVIEKAKAVVPISVATAYDILCTAPSSVLAAHDREVAARTLVAFADAHRMPFKMFERPDGSAVTVGDLLRERAAALRPGTEGSPD